MLLSYCINGMFSFKLRVRGVPWKGVPDETARSYEIKVKEMVEGERKALAGGVTKWGCTGTRGYVLIA